MDNLKLIEGILYLKGSDGLNIDEMMEITRMKEADIYIVLNKLKDKYADSALEISNFGGTYKLLTKAEYYEYYKNYLKGKPLKLSDSLVETAIIIAYNQPISRSSVEKIRGVDSSDAIRRLKNFNIIKDLGRSEEAGRPIMYGTDDVFLDHFGLKSLDELPQINKKDAF